MPTLHTSVHPPETNADHFSPQARCIHDAVPSTCRTCFRERARPASTARPYAAPGYRPKAEHLASRHRCHHGAPPRHCPICRSHDDVAARFATIIPVDQHGVIVETMSPDATSPVPFHVDIGTTWRHSGWSRDRQHVADALWRTGRHSNRLRAFVSCGATPIVLRSADDPNQFKIVSETCKDRFCVPCGSTRANVIAQNIRARMGTDTHRFLTLTVQSTDESLRDLITHLFTSFKRLRQDKTWCRHVAGGAAVLEVKYFKETNRWHPHLHIIIAGGYYPHPALKAAWKKASETSSVIDIRAIPRNDKVVQYITKYATKPFDASFIQLPERLDEAVVALKGVRTVTTFGTWRGLRLSEVESTGVWLNVGGLHDVVREHMNDETCHVAFWLQLTDQQREHLLDYTAAHAPPITERMDLEHVQAYPQPLLF